MKFGLSTPVRHEGMPMVGAQRMRPLTFAAIRPSDNGSA
jgi:hypothetical protein